MKNIKYFLKEQTEGAGEKLKHIEHLEDHPINDGAQGFEHALGALDRVKNHIEMKKHDSDLTMKHDGSPSIVYGHHPENGKFFVASKSAFNKTPKINYTDADVEKNHGHAPGLVEKLKAALHHIPKIVPKKGVFQGDMMFSGDDVKHQGGKVHFKPNTITYSAKENTPEGKKISKAKVGLYTHTEYRGKDATAMHANFNPDLSKFKNHPDVYHREPGHDTSKVNFKPEEKDIYEKHLAAAKTIHTKHGDQMYTPVSQHKDDLKTYVNTTIRTGETPSVEGLQHHITSNAGKAIDKVKTPAAKNKKSEELKSQLTHIQANKEHFNNFLKLHHHLQSAKNVLVHVLAKHTGGLEHTVAGEKVKPEGFVVNHEGKPTKLNDRKEFNRLNFLERKQ